MPDYDKTDDKLTTRQMSSMLRKHVPTATRDLALTNHTKDPRITNAVSAHRVLDVVTMESIEAALGDGIALDYLCKSFKVTKGQFQSWIFSDPDRTRRMARAINGGQYFRAVQVRSDILSSAAGATPDEVKHMKVQLQAAKDVESAVVPVDKSKGEDDGINVTFDFGSLFGNAAGVPSVLEQ